VSLRGHLLDMIHIHQDRLSKRLGIELTLQQTLQLTFNELNEKEGME
jgi:hypothetical protein